MNFGSLFPLFSGLNDGTAMSCHFMRSPVLRPAPQYLVEAGWSDGGRLIGCTQPRRVAVQVGGHGSGQQTGFSYDSMSVKMTWWCMVVVSDVAQHAMPNRHDACFFLLFCLPPFILLTLLFANLQPPSPSLPPSPSDRGCPSGRGDARVPRGSSRLRHSVRERHHTGRSS